MQQVTVEKNIKILHEAFAGADPRSFVYVVLVPPCSSLVAIPRLILHMEDSFSYLFYVPLHP